MRKRLLALIAACGIITPAIANEPWWCCDVCFNVSAGAEAIYWKPCTSDYAWGTTSESNPTTGVTANKNLAIKPNYDWGFRIFGTVSDECEENAVMLSWTYLDTFDSASKKSTLAFFGFNGGSSGVTSAEASERFFYHNVKLYGMHDFYKQCDNRFYAYAGGRYVFIRNRRKAKATVTDMGNLRDALDSKFSGGGIAVGLGGNVGLWCDFGLTLEAGIVGLVGERRLDIQTITAASDQPKEKTKFCNSRTICLPGIDAKIGLAWGRECWCVTVEAEVGYQIEHYFNVLAHTIPGQTPENLSIDDAGFAGPYIGVTLSY